MDHPQFNHPTNPKHTILVTQVTLTIIVFFVSNKSIFDVFTKCCSFMTDNILVNALTNNIVSNIYLLVHLQHHMQQVLQMIYQSDTNHKHYYC